MENCEKCYSEQCSECKKKEKLMEKERTKGILWNEKFEKYIKHNLKYTMGVSFISQCKTLRSKFVKKNPPPKGIVYDNTMLKDFCNKLSYLGKAKATKKSKKKRKSKKRKTHRKSKIVKRSRKTKGKQSKKSRSKRKSKSKKWRAGANIYPEK